MTALLRQSTSGLIRSIGPFVDDTDGKTPETGLTIANTDIKLMANGGASVDKSSGGGTHRANGVYSITFSSTDTATVGELFVSVSVAGALPVWARFFVIEEAVYDALFNAGSVGPNTATPLDAAGTRTALGLASANLDTQISDLPTVAEFSARTLASADYFDPTTDSVNVASVGGSAVSGPNDLKADVSALSLESTVNAIGVILEDVAAEVGKIPRGTSAIAAGQFAVQINGGEIAVFDISEPTP